jgi:hypothetical protein
MVIYSEKLSVFSLLDYSRSHSQLLFRSNKNKQRDYNIDIIFKGVLYINIPNQMNGLEISLKSTLPGNPKLINDSNYKVFSLVNSDEEEYYLNAMAFGVFRNGLDLLVSSINRYDLDSLGENILWYPTK